ncbi:DNA cytosine methyltransferase [Salibacterium aidingense]|uniref:DNA cytosine methyltransferase n=1 Tax=Salibacterium aidingense TaxID=384933 RepID=UPI0004106506|nr:DNA cytosine methyltransferase [Salibacterium aidingense]
MALIKERKAKVSKRGIYLQDQELMQTAFKPGVSYQYTVDPQSQSIMIHPASDSNNTVSKRWYQEKVKSVIDIRKKEALSALQGADYLTIEIFDDHITVTGHQETPRENEPVTTGQITFTRDALAAVVRENPSWNIPGYPNEVLGPVDEVLSAVSLFSGAGVFDIAWAEHFHIVAAIERDRHATQTYVANFPHLLQHQDIIRFDPAGMPQADVCFGGSPCQGFSNSNRHSHFLDNPNNKLVRHFIESVKANKQCKVFVLENVPQLLTAGDGQFLMEIEAALAEFEITSGVLEASTFGSPQYRKRAFVIGSKVGKIPLPIPYNSPKKTVQEAFQGLHTDIPNQTDVTTTGGETLERYKHVPEGGNVMDIPASIRPNGTHSTFYKRLRKTAPAPSIVHPRKAHILHPEKDRILTVRECARLFDVPDQFTFKGTLNAMQQQIANAVPVSLGKAIAQSVKEALTKKPLQAAW